MVHTNIYLFHGNVTYTALKFNPPNCCRPAAASLPSGYRATIPTLSRLILRLPEIHDTLPLLRAIEPNGVKPHRAGLLWYCSDPSSVAGRREATCVCARYLFPLCVGQQSAWPGWQLVASGFLRSLRTRTEKKKTQQQKG